MTHSPFYGFIENLIHSNNFCTVRHNLDELRLSTAALKKISVDTTSGSGTLRDF
jgi:hypothetical protein